MKIIKLDITDIGGIKAFEIEPNGKHVIIGGPNAAGKTTVLSAIAGALGGARNRKVQSIRQGAKRGSVVVDLGDIVVKWSAKKTGRDELVVETKEGAEFKSPAKRLEKLFGDRTVDPLAFFSAPPRDQARVLADIAGVDLDAMDNERAKVFAKRTLENRMLKERDNYVKSFGDVVTDMPGDAIDTSVIISELSDVKATIERNRGVREKLSKLEEDKKRLKRANIVAEENKSVIVADVKREADNSVNEAELALEDAKRRVERAKERRDEQVDLAKEQADKTIEESETSLNEVRDRIEKGQPVVAGLVDPDPDDVQKRFTDAQDMNRRIERLREYRSAQSKASGQRLVCEALTETLDAIDRRKASAIADASIPVDGLGLEDGLVTFNGLPLENLSGAERLRVSVALAIASSPDIRVMLIDKWGDLDDDSRKVVVDMADKHDFQIWTTIVGVKDEDITVAIVDGSRSPEGD